MRGVATFRAVRGLAPGQSTQNRTLGVISSPMGPFRSAVGTKPESVFPAYFLSSLTLNLALGFHSFSSRVCFLKPGTCTSSR